MAPQRLNRGLATLTLTSLLTLVALGGALLAVQIGASRAAGQSLSLETRHLEAVLEAMLLNLLANPEALETFIRQWTSCRSRMKLEDEDGHKVRIRFDRCHTAPDSVRVRMETGSVSLSRVANLLVRRRDGRWKIVPGSWHDFDP
ncbi:MAG TPA: hypothetical protein ENK53_09390 [Thiotrichales bacterium]|nr:hypothetical protein [Thiotrichales bacterium]